MDDQVRTDEHQQGLVGMSQREFIFVNDDLCVAPDRSPHKVDRFGKFDEIGCCRKFEDNRGRFAFARGVIQVQMRFRVFPGPLGFIKLAFEAWVEAKVFRILVDLVLVGF